jgi:hypothetical protein
MNVWSLFHFFFPCVIKFTAQQLSRYKTSQNIALLRFNPENSIKINRKLDIRSIAHQPKLL